MDFETAFDSLAAKIKSYNPHFDKKLLREAFDFGRKHHDGQKRSRGEPYFFHCIGVADILADKRMDMESIVTGLLHDTIEDTDVSIEQISELFGKQVATLVSGVTKMEVIENMTESAKQGENLRKLLLAISEDIRVLLVKLADRLHNIRTLKGLKQYEKRLRIANETLEIHIPLAERIGIRDWKEDLENICFEEINPDAYITIKRRLDFIKKNKGEEIIDFIIGELYTLIGENNVKGEISGRKKTIYSIWQKMNKKDVSFDQLADIIAFRIVVNSIEDCYRVLGLIHAEYKMIPDRFKDYISVPKENKYQSIHTSVIGPKRQRIEIQIRTAEMHEYAEMGVASHWQYKAGEVKNSLREGKNYRWLRQLLEILENNSEADELIADTKMEMYTENVFVFSPKGDIYNLPKGATSIDFAYAVHSKVGDKTAGTRINGRVVPLKTELKNGDQVEIITKNNAEPKESWQGLVVSGKARSAIRRFMHNKKREEYIENGKSMLIRAFKAVDKELTERHLEKLYKKYNYKTIEAYFVGVGDGTVGVNESLFTIYPEYRENQKTPKVIQSSTPTNKHTANQGKAGMIGGLIDGISVRFPRCCHAIPGDMIVGVVYTGQGISIHNKNCSELKKEADIQNKTIDVYWLNDGVKEAIFTGRVNVVISNNNSAINDITTTAMNQKVHIENLKILSRTGEFLDIMLDVEVKSVSSLTDFIVALRMINDIVSVARV